MKVGIFSPYLNTLGGGERYILTIAGYLSNAGHKVEIFWNDKAIKSKIEKQLDINLNRVNFVEDIFYSRRNLLGRWRIIRKYDVIFYLSDGSIPFLFAKKNILHFQVPFTGVGGRSIFNRIKFQKINCVICNSKFTKKFIDKEYGIESEVIYPPVDVESFKPGKKQNLILAVGRFSQSLHAKKQEVLIRAFKNLSPQLSGWKLVLAGGLATDDKNYFKSLENLARGFPVDCQPNLSFEDLKKLYGQAKIFWQATGFGEDEAKHSERMEHFGISVVEAMAAGCVPVVIGKGGILEIVTDEKDGFLWQTPEELEKLTLQLIKVPELLKKISLQSIKSSKKFSKTVFCKKIDELIKG